MSVLITKERQAEILDIRNQIDTIILHLIKNNDVIEYHHFKWFFRYNPLYSGYVKNYQIGQSLIWLIKNKKVKLEGNIFKLGINQ